MGIRLRTIPKWRLDKDDGTPAAGWKVYTYIPGTTDDKTTYSDQAGSVPNTNPIILDANGEATVWWNGVYDLKWTDENDANSETFSNYGEGEDTVNYGNYNAVNDGGFEDDSNGDNLPDQWDVTEYPTAGSGAGVAVIDTSDQIEGLNSLKFTSSGDGGGYAESAFFEVTQAEVLGVSFYLKSSAADVRNLVEIVWYTGAKTSISTSSLYDDSATNPTSWTQKTATATAVTNARYAKIRVTGCHSSDATTGSTWYDKVDVLHESVLGNTSFSGNITGTINITGTPVLANNAALQGKETGGTARDLAQINSSDEAQLCSVNSDVLLAFQNWVKLAGQDLHINDWAGNLALSAGGKWNGSNWIATATTASILELDGSNITIFYNSGLTAPNTFVPTIKFRIDNTGEITTGIIDYSGSIITNKSTWAAGDDPQNSTAFDVATNVGAAWESVGPTGSGATNIWTPMDGVAGKDWVEVLIENYCVDTTGSSLNQIVFARKTGASSGAGDGTRVSHCAASGDGTDSLAQLSNIVRKIPIDASGRFDLYFSSDGTGRIVETFFTGSGNN